VGTAVATVGMGQDQRVLAVVQLSAMRAVATELLRLLEAGSVERACKILNAQIDACTDELERLET
jgi:hypothetical protein